MYTLGTAGHVDHGKSALVKALTGIDPDRLQEEKERGLTIDLGFAWLKLPSGQEVSIVDVPGHERFIRNMLAGVGGIDLALLVVAADEGVMPQTREHLAILDLLKVKHGIIAVTKVDLVDADWLELVRAEVSELLEGTTLSGSPLVACSARTGEGLKQLLEVMERELAAIPPRPDIGRARLPIDRAFTIAGFGTVVTGTLSGGTLRPGQEVEILPGRLRSRIRGLQTHGQKTEAAPPGRRTAVNLAGVEVEQLRRGMVVASAGWLRPTRNLDVRLQAVSYLGRPLRHNMEVSFHSGSTELQGRLLLLDRDRLAPGEQGWAQLRLAGEAAVAKGDYFVIRDPNDTLGGGKIVDVDVRRHKRFHAPLLEALARLEEGSPGEQVLLLLERGEPLTIGQISQEAQLNEETVLSAAAGLIQQGKLVSLEQGALQRESVVLSKESLERLSESARQALQAYHREFPLRPGMPREDLRGRLGLEGRAFEQALDRWQEEGWLRGNASWARLSEHEPTLSPPQVESKSGLLAALRANPFAPELNGLPDPDLLAYLEERGEIVRASESVIFSAEAYRQMTERVLDHLQANGSITLAQVRDMFGNSRKYAQALLERLDRQRVTRRVGDERVLRQ